MRSSFRQAWMWFHRWTGLAIASFLVVAGLTGSVLVFAEELDRWLNPQLYEAQPRGQVLSPVELLQIAQRHIPADSATSILLDLHRPPGQAALIFVSPREAAPTSSKQALQFDQMFIDPYSGRVLGTRLRSTNVIDRGHVVPMLLRLHDALLLPDPWGKWLLGGVALLWTASCFAGLYLTLPVRRRGFLSGWSKAWQVRLTRSIPRLSFDLHRAAGLWGWAVMLVLAISAVQFNLRAELFLPILKATLTVHDAWGALPERAAVAGEADLQWREALARGRELMGRHAHEEGFAVQHESGLSLDLVSGVYVYTVKSTRDVRDRFGETRILFSASDGKELGFTHPRIASGNAVSSWLSALHTGRVWGWPLRILLCIGGLATAVLSITGVIVWLKRSA